MANAVAIVSEARAMGLDVDAERADADLVALAVVRLRQVPAEQRASVARFMNEGWSFAEAKSLANVRAARGATAHDARTFDERTFDAGASFGLEAYCVERQRLRTYDAPRIVGYLSSCATDSAWSRGVLHGLALGANLQRAQADLTSQLRLARAS